MIKNIKVALIYRITALLIAILGFLYMTGIFHGNFYPGIMMFYTMQSNLIAIVLFGLLLYKTIKGLRKDPSEPPSYYPRLVMNVSVVILITLIVYWVLLAPQTFMMDTDFNLWSFGNLAVHTFTPLLVLFDYVLFSSAGHLKLNDVFYVLIFPAFYLLFSSVAGLLGYVYFISPIDDLPVHYPYFFYDFDRVGAWAILYIALLMLFFLFIGYIYYLIDKLRVRKNLNKGIVG